MNKVTLHTQQNYFFPFFFPYLRFSLTLDRLLLYYYPNKQ